MPLPDVKDGAMQNNLKICNPKPPDYGFKSPILFIMITFLLIISWEWPRRWLGSGAPILHLTILTGESQGHRILPSWNLWPVLTTMHLVYGVCSTSWLLYWGFSLACYPAIFLVCLFQFQAVGDIVRRTLRRTLRWELRHLHFVNDKIAIFQIPAIEIDLKVGGLFVVRGFTFLLSDLSFLAHGIEVVIRLSDDMEMAVRAESMRVKFFRGIEISDCYVNIKAGKIEKSFGNFERETKGFQTDAEFMGDNPLLVAASEEEDKRSYGGRDSTKLTADLTEEKPLSASPKFHAIESIPLNDAEAQDRYENILGFFRHTDAINDAFSHIRKAKADSENTEHNFDISDINAMRAAICSELHFHPSISHPPSKSIRISSIKSLISPRAQVLIHRLPLFIRLVLGPFSYFHPMKIQSITATTSGRPLDSFLIAKVFGSYGDKDNEIGILKDRVSTWLSKANFVIETVGITGAVQVPLLTQYNINCLFNFEDVMAYRSLPDPVNLNQVARLGGADARFEIPIFLLPHHEHLLPPLLTESDKERLSCKIEQADSPPKKIQAESSLAEALKDETNVKISVHARLPAVFDQDLLNFLAALLKASKIVEIVKEGEASAIFYEAHGIKEMSQNWKDVKRSFKRGLVDGVVNEKWIARLMGKVAAKLELAQGEAGYSGNLPVNLRRYRTGLLDREGEKLLP